MQHFESTIALSINVINYRIEILLFLHIVYTKTVGITYVYRFKK